MFLAIGVEGEEIFWSVTQALSNHNNSVTISHAVVITDETKQRVCLKDIWILLSSNDYK